MTIIQMQNLQVGDDITIGSTVGDVLVLTVNIGTNVVITTNKPISKSAFGKTDEVRVHNR
jgi:UDP-3-O-[3-hydroxymyristoyl] glucosamine N-acyltransferase